MKIHQWDKNKQELQKLVILDFNLVQVLPQIMEEVYWSQPQGGDWNDLVSLLESTHALNVFIYTVIVTDTFGAHLFSSCCDKSKHLQWKRHLAPLKSVFLFWRSPDLLSCCSAAAQLAFIPSVNSQHTGQFVSPVCFFPPSTVQSNIWSWIKCPT